MANIYDHFTPMVLMGLEDFQLAPKENPGRSSPRETSDWGGRSPCNTHGGNLAEVYNHGMSHVYEAMRQLRGTSSNQVAGRRAVRSSWPVPARAPPARCC